MTGLFKVLYFDPARTDLNMEAFNVTAINAVEAIRKADRMKTLKKYRVQSVECIGFSDEP